MPLTAPWHRLVPLLICLGATSCSQIEDTAASETAGVTVGSSSSETNGGEESTGGDCPPGNSGCPCANGDLCVAGLSCVESICSGSAPSTSGSSCVAGELGCPCAADVVLFCENPWSCDTVTETCVKNPEDGDPCAANEDCPDTSVCQGLLCVPIDSLYFSVTIQQFAPLSCVDEDEGGTKALFFDYFAEGEYRSSSDDGGCPGSWPTEAIVYDSLETFQLAIWDRDDVTHDLEASFCWGELGGECEEIPDSVIRDGGFFDGVNGQGVFAIEIEPCSSFEACPS